LLTPTKNAYRFGAASWAAMLRMAAIALAIETISTMLANLMATSFRKMDLRREYSRGAFAPRSPS
jgi:hypothetical protein